jgi:hypothetical protein
MPAHRRFSAEALLISRIPSVAGANGEEQQRGDLTRSQFPSGRSVLARLSLSAFARNLAHWSQLGWAGAFSTSFESCGSTQRGKGMVQIWVDATVGATRNWVITALTRFD